MINDGYRFQFARGVSLRDAEDTLLLAILAVEGIHGQSRVWMDAAYVIDAHLRIIVVDGATQVGQDVGGVFTSFLTRQFGVKAFCVGRLDLEVKS